MDREQLTELQRLEFKQAFELFDKDHSGSISTKELLPVLRSIGQNPTEDEILNLVIEYDVNGDGTIDFEEFLDMMTKQARDVDQTAEIREAFKIFDRDGNGFIDMAELRHIITRLGDILSPQEADEFMREADLNGDGKLDYDEFLKYMRELEKDEQLQQVESLAKSQKR